MLDYPREAAEGGYHGLDLVLGHRLRASRSAGVCLRGDFLGLGIGDLGADHGGVAAGFEAGPVLINLCVVPDDPCLSRLSTGPGVRVFEPFGLLGDLLHSRAQAVGIEEFR